MPHPFLILSLSSIFAALGQLLLKLGTKPEGWQMLFSLHLWGGLGLYALSTALWIVGLSRVTLNVAYPFTVLTFTLVFLLSWLVLGEPLSLIQMVGLFAIAGGFILMTVA
jgi:drug/metabolite transporter (DMT)-like permease